MRSVNECLLLLVLALSLLSVYIISHHEDAASTSSLRGKEEYLRRVWTRIFKPRQREDDDQEGRRREDDVVASEENVPEAFINETRGRSYSLTLRVMASS